MSITLGYPASATGVFFKGVDPVILKPEQGFCL